MDTNFFINDNEDVLIEILKRLDGRSLGVAACVCKLWCGIARNDSLWEHLCFRHVSPPLEGVRTVVLALGGYRRLYMVCVRPVLNRLRKWRPVGIESDSEIVRRVYWTRHEVELSLSLFCVDYYERVLLTGGSGDGGGGGGGGRHDGGDAAAAPCVSSLMFLCKAVNV
ncbi:F-box protein SNE-like [Solanum lycopersicum]|uniref:F-box protein SNE-like n=1 Tax=Solanum lycopersicum TaxID=4081 RepID=UPI000276AC23|nr:F-box protein SNE-like [Solanum lycopersicum]